MMLSHGVVWNNIVVCKSVLAWTEVPGLLHRVITSLLQPLQLVLKIQNVVGLLVPQSPVTVASQHVQHALLFHLLNGFLCLRVGIHLSDWIVQRIVRFNKLVSHLYVRLRLELKLFLFLCVVLNVVSPLRVTVGHFKLFRQIAYVCCH